MDVRGQPAYNAMHHLMVKIAQSRSSLIGRQIRERLTVGSGGLFLRALSDRATVVCRTSVVKTDHAITPPMNPAHRKDENRGESLSSLIFGRLNSWPPARAGSWFKNDHVDP